MSLTLTDFQLVRTPESTYKILDVQFLSDRQIVSIRRIDGETYPCIDIYDLPELASVVQSQTSDPSDAAIGTQNLPELLLVASFRLFLSGLRKPDVSGLGILRIRTGSQTLPLLFAHR